MLAMKVREEARTRGGRVSGEGGGPAPGGARPGGRRKAREEVPHSQMEGRGRGMEGQRVPHAQERGQFVFEPVELGACRGDVAAFERLVQEA